MIKRLALMILSSALLAYSAFLAEELILRSLELLSLILVIPLSLSLQVFFSTLRINKVHASVGVAFAMIFLELILFSYFSLLSKIILLIGILLEIQIAIWPKKILYQSLPIYFITLIYAINQLWGDPRIFLFCILLAISLLLNSESKVTSLFLFIQILIISFTIFSYNILILIIGTIITLSISLTYRFLKVRNK